MLIKVALLACLISSVDATLAGGRLNSFSEGQNAFAGVLNPANAVWVPNRLDVGAYYVHQQSSFKTPAGKTDLTYHAKSILTFDAAGHGHFPLQLGCKNYDSSLSLAVYSTPNTIKLHTKKPIAAIGTSPLRLFNQTRVISTVFSIKLHENHSLGIGVDYYLLTHKRYGFQNADNPLRSVSPGHVTNNGTDKSGGFGLTVGWRWNISKQLLFGVAWTRKSYCGQFRKYRGYEPHHAHNYTPQLIGAGFTYRFSTKLAGRLEALWTQFGNLPNSNNNFLPNGTPNRHKRGSKKSPGAGLQDATFINCGLGYRITDDFSLGAGYSHRIKLKSSKNLLSRSYRRQTIYDTATLGSTYNIGKHNLFLGLSWGFKNRLKGYAPQGVNKIPLSSQKQNAALSFSWGYLY